MAGRRKKDKRYKTDWKYGEKITREKEEMESRERKEKIMRSTEADIEDRRLRDDKKKIFYL